MFVRHLNGSPTLGDTGVQTITDASGTWVVNPDGSRAPYNPPNAPMANTGTIYSPGDIIVNAAGTWIVNANGSLSPWNPNVAPPAQAPAPAPANALPTDPITGQVINPGNVGVTGNIQTYFSNLWNSSHTAITDPQQFYYAAQHFGVSGQVLDYALGLPAGTAQPWIDHYAAVANPTTPTAQPNQWNTNPVSTAPGTPLPPAYTDQAASPIPVINAPAQAVSPTHSATQPPSISTTPAPSPARSTTSTSPVPPGAQSFGPTAGPTAGPSDTGTMGFDIAQLGDLFPNTDIGGGSGGGAAGGTAAPSKTLIIAGLGLLALALLSK